jgi:RNA polymerase sigma-70 factor (ECF subfamily)
MARRHALVALVKDQPASTRREGLESLYREHSAQVFNAAFRVTGNAMDAEDVLQTVFLGLARRLRELDVEPEAWPFYLRRSAINASLDLLRGRKRRRTEPIESTTQDAADAAGSGRDDRAEEAELRESLRLALASESSRSAEVFALRYFEGYGNREIARMLGTSPSAIGVVLHRTRARLRGRLGDDAGERMRSER